jgi:Bacterial low temperature requirement A protein (LtrA)
MTSHNSSDKESSTDKQAHKDTHAHKESHGPHHHHNDDLFHDTNMPSYLAPQQRQRWGEAQLPPHTDWGDIFFDLFYVAAAYNLGSLLRDDPTKRGLLYVIGCFVPIFHLWSQTMIYRSRFYVLNDVYHRLFEAAVLLPLATAIWHIRGVKYLSHPEEYRDMFYYTLNIFIAQMLVIVRYLEVMVGTKAGAEHLHPESFPAGLGNILIQLPTAILFLAATIYTGIKGRDISSDNEHRRLGETSASAYEDDSYGSDDVAIWLCVMANMMNILSMILFFVCYLKSRGDQYKK